MKKTFTLCLVHQHPRVLLGMKKRGFGAGRWNGFGGKVEEGESIEEAAVREIEEEAGIIPKAITKHGILTFSWEGKDDELEVHVFRAEEFEGVLRESDEMKPQWFLIDEIPYAEMWDDDRHWFPLFFDKKKFRGKFIFNDADRLVEKQLSECDIF